MSDDAATAPQFVIVMGVSGSGKTTLAEAIAQRMGWTFAEGDDFHPKANVEKMSKGEPLTDADRWPWLQAIGAWIDDREASGESAVITCSALKRTYRDLLREGRPGVTFCHVDVDQKVLENRLDKREGHYMPASLLPSQLADLEPLQPDEPGAVVHGDGGEEQVLQQAFSALGLTPPADPASDETPASGSASW